MNYLHNKKIILIAVLLFSLVSCSKKDKGKNNANAGKDSTKTIVFWDQEDAVLAPYLDSITAEFEKANPGTKVIRTHYSPEDLHTQFQNASIAGNPADVVLSVSDKAGLFSISGFIIPVDGLFDLTQFSPNVVAGIQQDGKTWGVPNSNGNQLMLYYNKEYVKTPPTTTNELFQLCDQIIQLPTKNDPKRKLTCFEISGGDPFWLTPFLSGFGGWPIDGHKPTLNTDQMVKALDFVLNLKKKGYISKECDYNCMDSMYKEGNTAMIVNGDWTIGTYLEAMKGTMGVAVLPVMSETGLYMAPATSGKYFLISNNVKGEKLELVKKLINTFNSVKNQTRMKVELKKIPALRSIYESQDMQADPVFAVMSKQIELGKPMPIAVEMRAIWDTMRPYFGRVMSEKMKSTEAVKSMQEEVTKRINEMKM